MRYDPRWITARFNRGNCPMCGQAHKKGDRLFYYPVGLQVYCEKCGEDRAAEFRAIIADERFYNNQ